MAEKTYISDAADDVENWYQEYYKRKGLDRDDPMNPEVIFQEFAYRRCFVDAFSAIPRDARILDVGGGQGTGLTRLLDFQFDRAGLHLLDLHPERVKRAAAQLGPNGMEQGSATGMDMFDDASMDVVYSCSTFIHLDPKIWPEVAAEMVRVLRPGGKLMIFDWDLARASDPFNPVTRKKLDRILAPIGGMTFVRTTHGPLYPPLGRKLSRYAPAIYFLVSMIRPLIGFHGYIYEKAK